MPSRCPNPVSNARVAAPHGVHLRGGAVLCGVLLVLAAAGSLRPDPAGHGTHEQLGWPPCSFLVRTGTYCPMCGLTTSLSAGANGRVLAAARAHLMGLVLLAGMAALAGAGAAELTGGRPVLHRLHLRHWPAALGAAMVVGWAVKVLTGPPV